MAVPRGTTTAGAVDPITGGGVTQELMITGKVERVVIVVMDGLRPDAITHFGLENTLRLARNGASTFAARTVAPSVTAAAMGSLLTGAAPSRHGLESDRFGIPRPRGELHPLPAELEAAGMPCSAFIGHVPWLMRPLAMRIARRLGFSTARFRGRSALEVLAAARPTITSQSSGMILMHWGDADRAGHEHGWMSERYGEAAQVLDAALGLLMRLVDLNDRRTVLIALADHGGGGRQRRHHDSDHPADRTIPIIFAGGAVRPATLGDGLSLLDVPATTLAMLGVPLPESFGGRSLVRVAPRHGPVPETPALAAA